MFTILIYAQSLRFAIPAAVMVGVAPHYILIWTFWRGVSAFMPRRIYERVDEEFYDMYQSLVTYFFETYNGTNVILYGDDLPVHKKENILYLCNHQSTVDWIITDLLAIRQGSLGDIRYILKDGLRYLPLYGFYFAQHGCIYVKRNDKRNDQRIRQKLGGFKKNKTPVWIVIYPEGTRYNIKKPNVIKTSQEFSKENGLPVFEHVLVPRSKAVEVTLCELSDYLDAIYDLTIVYRNTNSPLLPKSEGPSLTEFLSVGGQEIHLHLERIESDLIPKGNTNVKEWLIKQFHKKDRLLSHFYTDGSFPGDPKTVTLRTRRTLPYFIGWTVLLGATLTTQRGRSLYMKSWLCTGVTTALYMALLYDFVQA